MKEWRKKIYIYIYIYIYQPLNLGRAFSSTGSGYAYVNARGTGTPPLAVVAVGTTETGTIPAVRDGNMHSMNPVSWKMTADASRVPTLTPLTLDGVAPNAKPYTDTMYPPSVDPADGTSEVTVGAIAAGSKYANVAGDTAGVPPPETEMTATGPAVGVALAAVVHRISAGETKLTAAHDTPATKTLVMSDCAVASAAPTMVMTVPPVMGPDVGLIKVIDGGPPPGITGPPPADPVYANPTAGTAVANTPPVGDDTVTGDWAIRLDTGAVVHVTSESETTAKVAHGTLVDTLTATTSPKAIPWSVTTVPPAMGPDTGTTAETTGAVKVNDGPEPEPAEAVETTVGPDVVDPTGATPVTQSMCVALRQAKGAHDTPARVTAKTSAPETPRPTPATRTDLPSTRPAFSGETRVTLGADAYTKGTGAESPCTVEIDTDTAAIGAAAGGAKTITCELDIQATMVALAPSTSTWVTWDAE
jgi:hypothetical protein